MPRYTAIALAAGLALIAGWVVPPAAALSPQEEAQLRAQAEKNRKAVLEANLTLTPKESEAFWPLYDEYRRAMLAVNEQIADLIREYAAHVDDLSDERSVSLMRRALDLDLERARMRQRYFPRFLKVLPARKAVRYYQIEHKMDAVVDYQLVDAIPLVKPGE